MIKKRQTILLILLLLCAACTPYDSNKANRELLQGSWLMTDIYHEEQDSTFVPEFLPEDSIILRFEKDNYTEYLGETERELDLTFDVYNYRVILYKNGTIYDWIDIDVLTKDSLVLNKTDYKWKYKKME